MGEKKNYKSYGNHYLMRSKNCERRLLPSLCLFTCLEQLGSHCTDFHEIWILRNFKTLQTESSST